MDADKLINPRDDVSGLFLLDSSIPADKWLGTQKFNIQETASYTYGRDVPLQQELLRYVDVNLVQDSSNGKQYDASKFITEQNPIFNVKLTRVGPMVVDSLSQKIHYQVSDFPATYTLR